MNREQAVKLVDALENFLDVADEYRVANRLDVEMGHIRDALAEAKRNLVEALVEAFGAPCPPSGW